MSSDVEFLILCGRRQPEAAGFVARRLEGDFGITNTTPISMLVEISHCQLQPVLVNGFSRRCLVIPQSLLNLEPFDVKEGCPSTTLTALKGCSNIKDKFGDLRGHARRRDKRHTAQRQHVDAGDALSEPTMAEPYVRQT